MKCFDGSWNVQPFNQSTLNTVFTEAQQHKSAAPQQQRQPSPVKNPLQQSWLKSVAFLQSESWTADHHHHCIPAK